MAAVAALTSASGCQVVLQQQRQQRGGQKGREGAGEPLKR